MISIEDLKKISEKQVAEKAKKTERLKKRKQDLLDQIEAMHDELYNYVEAVSFIWCHYVNIDTSGPLNLIINYDDRSKGHDIIDCKIIDEHAHFIMWIDKNSMYIDRRNIIGYINEELQDLIEKLELFIEDAKTSISALNSEVKRLAKTV